MNHSLLERYALDVLELRQYTLHPHKRDVLIDLFDREFLETQDAVGMPVLGQFRDLDDANRFVWLRGFSTMQTRHDALAAFYGGAVWQTHRNVANATMIDSDNVLLLRPAWAGAHFPVDLRGRADKRESTIPRGFVDLTIFYLKQPASADLLAFCRQEMAQVLGEGGAIQQGWYVNETSENTFTRLPVRTGECVLVGLALFEDVRAYETFGASMAWQQKIAPQLAAYLLKTAESHRLAPTARSALHA
ncbi:MAG: NIPSNAP family protein [Polaromonas sp.]|uniref:NIPSNAP family protein n=1 Tax=Polaromonas sp. TaxID=1869339 RepID=UPI00185B23DE|nr:NIPSNAP family protein [Polaromonas sp.]MBA3592700.1 NIPSNAP family protein [Polaromonas sp.]